MPRYQLRLDLTLTAAFPLALRASLASATLLPLPAHQIGLPTLTALPDGWRLSLHCELHCALSAIAELLAKLAPWCKEAESTVVGRLENLDDARELIEDIVYSQKNLLLVAAQAGPDDLYNYYR